MRIIGQHTQDAADRILYAFQHAETLPAALAPIFIRRNDGTPCRAWSFSNQLLVALAGTQDARGFRQWHEAGRSVKKGARALWILIPLVSKETDEDGEDKARNAADQPHQADCSHGPRRTAPAQTGHSDYSEAQEATQAQTRARARSDHSGSHGRNARARLVACWILTGSSHAVGARRVDALDFCA